MNTAISYLYRDAHNYKEFGEEVLEGELDEAQQQAILDMGEDFLPGYFDLPVLRVGYNLEFDHIWHEVTEVYPTTSKPTVSLTAADFVEQVYRLEMDVAERQAIEALPTFVHTPSARKDQS